MRQKIQMFAALTIMLIIGTISARGQTGQRIALPVITEYLELIASGNYDIASDMWAPEAIERAGRFGLRYTDIVIKQDCNSPIIRNLDDFGVNPISPIRRYEPLGDSSWYQMEYSDIRGSQLLKHSYYLERRGDWFWLNFRQNYYAADWPITESRYFRIHVQPETQHYINDVSLAEADRFVEQTARQIGISKSRLAEIAESKLEYFYCSSDTVVQELSGFLVKGTLDLASNDIISSDFPHFHELAHLLVNIKLGEMPLYSLPLTREGIAVYLGGRWGKHPAALLDLAIFLYREDLVEFDSVLTMSGFQSQAGADIVYPVAGIFCDYLIDKLGMADFLDLYVKLSGPFDYVNGLGMNDVGLILADAVGKKDWVSLIKDFEKFLSKERDKRTMALPGCDKKGKELVRTDRYLVREKGDWLSFEFYGMPADSFMQGNLVFGKIAELGEARSAMFDSQYEGSQTFDGYRYGVRFDQYEAGLYDYVTNRLVAKYIWGITPSDDYFDAETKKVCFRIRKSLVNGVLPQVDDCRLLPN